MTSKRFSQARRPDFLFLLFAQGAGAVAGDDQEADQRQDERGVDGGQETDRAEVDDHALERGHQRTAYDGHDQESRAERRVLVVDILQGDAVDGREHQGHEETDGDEAVQSRHAHDEDGPQRGEGGPDAEDSQQLARIDVLHQEGADETAAEEHRHREDIVPLGRGLVDAEVVGVLDDEGPYHDLRGDIEDLGQDTFPIHRILPQPGEGVADLRFGTFLA